MSVVLLFLRSQVSLLHLLPDFIYTCHVIPSLQTHIRSYVRCTRLLIESSLCKKRLVCLQLILCIESMELKGTNMFALLDFTIN